MAETTANNLDNIQNYVDGIDGEKQTDTNGTVDKTQDRTDLKKDGEVEEIEDEDDSESQEETEEEQEVVTIIDQPLEEDDDDSGRSSNKSNIKEITTRKFCNIPVPRWADLFVEFVLPPLVWAISDIADVVSDILVAVSHYRDGNDLYFGMTLAFVFAPSLVLYLLALNSLFQDRFTTYCRILMKFVVYSIAIWTLSLWPVGSYLQMVFYGMKAVLNKRKSTEYIYMWKKLQDESLPSYYVIKAFLECAPQLALQLYIMLSNPPANQHKLTVLLQIVSCSLSLISMAGKSIKFRQYIQEAKMATYSDDSSSNCIVSLWNTFLSIGDYLWWSCSIAARMMAIVMFASVFKSWIFLVCFGHASIMVIWIVYNQRLPSVHFFLVWHTFHV